MGPSREHPPDTPTPSNPYRERLVWCSMQIVGRSSSHFTRMPLIFAHELGVPFEFAPVYDMTSMESEIYAGNPALKLPILRTESSSLFGAQNICRALAEIAGSPKRIVWPEELRDNLSRNAQELVWHGMSTQVQVAFGTIICQLPTDNTYFVKARSGLERSLAWLDKNLDTVLRTLPPRRDLSLFEVSLFCLVDHLAFRRTVDIAPFCALMRFAEEFGARPSSRDTIYRFDTPPAAPA
jgi:glutathione S-transferase